MPDPLKHVVIVGAGFGGLSATKALAKSEIQITLIDQQNHHLFQPLLYQVATAALTPAEIAVPIRHVLRSQKNVRVVMDRVTGVDCDAKEVLCDSGQRIGYDRLILATGAGHSYFGNDAWADHAPGLKTLQDASFLRERILTAFERAELLAESAPAIAKSYQSFVIIGAGPTGVELAGAVAELAGSVMRDFRHIDAADTRVILLEGGGRVLPSFAPSLSLRAAADLRELGVDLRLNTLVTGVSAESVETNHDDIAARTVIWAAGVQASPAARWLGLKAGSAGHVEVDQTLRPDGLENVYVIGDTARFAPEGDALPGIAPVAKQMGQYVGARLAAEAAGRSFESVFRYRDAGASATIGRNRAVADIFGLKVKGLVGWLLWGLAHVYFLIGFKNRLFVVLNWFWSYLTWQRGVRLIMHAGTRLPPPSN